MCPCPMCLRVESKESRSFHWMEFIYLRSEENSELAFRRASDDIRSQEDRRLKAIRFDSICLTMVVYIQQPFDTMSTFYCRYMWIILNYIFILFHCCFFFFHSPFSVDLQCVLSGWHIVGIESFFVVVVVEANIPWCFHHQPLLYNWTQQQQQQRHNWRMDKMCD